MRKNYNNMNYVEMFKVIVNALQNYNNYKIS